MRANLVDKQNLDLNPVNTWTPVISENGNLSSNYRYKKCSTILLGTRWGTPNHRKSLENPQKWRDLDEYIILGTKNFFLLQVSAKMSALDEVDFFPPQVSFRMISRASCCLAVSSGTLWNITRWPPLRRYGTRLLDYTIIVPLVRISLKMKFWRHSGPARKMCSNTSGTSCLHVDIKTLSWLHSF